VKTLLLVVGIVSSVTAPLCFAVLPKPPTPPSFSASYKRESFLKALRLLFSPKPKEIGGRGSTSGIRERVDFLVIFVAFSILVAAFDAFATLLDQIFSPYGYDSDQSGYFGAVLILSGIVAAIVSAPIFDRLFFKHLALAGKILAPISAISYLGLIFAIKENDMAGIYFLMVFVGPHLLRLRLRKDRRVADPPSLFETLSARRQFFHSPSCRFGTIGRGHFRDHAARDEH
jgi:FLVCR family MFS transporter 7